MMQVRAYLNILLKVICLDTLFLNSRYTYSMLQMDIEATSELYSFVEVISIGKSILGKDISAIKIGTGKKQVFYSRFFSSETNG